MGVDIAANKFKGVRSALADDVATAKQSREHDDTNILSLPADEVNFELAKQIITVWLETPFSNGEKYKKKNWKNRVAKNQPATFKNSQRGRLVFLKVSVYQR